MQGCYEIIKNICQYMLTWKVIFSEKKASCRIAFLEKVWSVFCFKKRVLYIHTNAKIHELILFVDTMQIHIKKSLQDNSPDLSLWLSLGSKKTKLTYYLSVMDFLVKTNGKTSIPTKIYVYIYTQNILPTILGTFLTVQVILLNFKNEILLYIKCN